MAFLAVCGPNNPTIEVAFDWQNDPASLNSSNLTDITPYLVSYTRAPVRTNEFDQPGPAGATLVLRNDDGRFTPDNTSGPYAGGLKRFRRCRIRAQWAGVTYNRFYGYIQNWPQTWASSGQDSTVTLQLLDNLFPLQTFDLGIDPATKGGLGSQVSGAMFQSAVLDSHVNVLGGMSGIVTADTGKSTIPNFFPTSPSYSLQFIQNIAATEQGIAYARGDGQYMFHDRAHRTTATRSLNSQATIGDGAGNSEIPYSDTVQPEFSDAWGVVNVTPAGGSAQIVTNTAAALASFNQTLSYPPAGTYLVSDPVEALHAAEYVSNRYAAPATRLPAVELIGMAAPAQWPTILGLDTSDRVIFKRRPDGSSTISLNCFVEGYGDNVQVGKDWRVSLALSPALIQQYWVLADSTFGVLGTTTALTY